MRSLGKLVVDSRSTEYCSGPFCLYCSSLVPVKGHQSRVKFPSSRIHDESDPIDPTQKHKFQFPDPRRVRSHQTHQSSSSQGSSSSSKGVKFQVSVQFPDPRRVRSHRSDSPFQFLSRFRSCQGQGPVPVPIPGSKSVPDSAIRVRSHRSDSVLLFSLRFQVPDRTEINCFSWWFDSGIRNPSVWCPRQQVPLRSSGRLFIDLPRRPTLRTVRIRVLN